MSEPKVENLNQQAQIQVISERLHELSSEKLNAILEIINSKSDVKQLKPELSEAYDRINLILEKLDKKREDLKTENPDLNFDEMFKEFKACIESFKIRMKTYTGTIDTISEGTDRLEFLTTKLFAIKKENYKLYCDSIGDGPTYDTLYSTVLSEIRFIASKLKNWYVDEAGVKSAYDTNSYDYNA